MLADSRRSDIAARIIARLQLIVGGDTYWHTAQSVKRGHVDLNEVDPNATPQITMDLEPESRSEADESILGEQTATDLPVSIRGTGYSSSKDRAILFREADRLLRDMTLALMSDATLGSVLRRPLEITAARTTIEDGRVGFYTAALDVIAVYRLNWSSP